MTNKIKNLIETLPNNPGCYQMYDKNNQIIYVGKAKNLKKRVSQYFLRPQSGKVFEMVRNVDYFDYIITKNESEAFILEFNLIHKHMPKYNILLKDDKHYPYIALKKEGIIEVKLKRNIKDKNYVYFGPYPKSSFASEVIDLVNQLFPTKKCNFLPKKPCLYYHLGQCLGYCINNVSSDENKILYEKINSFLKGDTKEIESKLKSEIQKNNDNLKFEESIRYKKLLDAIQHVKTIQTVDFNSNENKDFFAYSSYNNYVCVSLFIYRNGMLLGKDQFVSEIFEDEIQTVSDIILQFYINNVLPNEIYVFSNDVAKNLEGYLNAKILVPTKGKNYDVLNKLLLNANKSLEKYFNVQIFNEKHKESLNELKDLLKIDSCNYIELFDNSHISGCDAVSVSVAFVNGEPCKKLYRKFKLSNSNTRSDVDNMREVLTRKYKRMIKENVSFPDLILLDGGITQIHIANEVFSKLDISINVFGLYKNDKHQTEGIIDSNGNKYVLEKNSNLYLFLSLMQNEVHRFAITYFRASHLNSYKKSIFDDITGLGKVKKSLLYEIYPDLDHLRQATLDELSQILNKNVALRLYNKLHGEDDLL